MIELCIFGVEGSFGRIIRNFTKTYKNMEMDMFYLTLKNPISLPKVHLINCIHLLLLVKIKYIVLVVFFIAYFVIYILNQLC